LAILDDTIDRVVIAVVSVKPEILLVFVGEFNAPPLAQTTCPVPVCKWLLL
jgi:hypothetical protein